MDMADWRAGGHVTDAWSTRDPIGPRFDVNDSISRWSRARSVAPERIHHHHYHHHHHHHHARNRCSVAKEVVARVGVTTNCIVTRKLRDYGARGNHRECGACARREVAHHRENGGRARKGVEAVRRQREDEEEGGGGRRLKQLLFILSDRIRGPSEWEREFKLLASLNFHCSVFHARSLPFRVPSIRIQCSSSIESSIYPSHRSRANAAALPRNGND